MKLYGTTTSPFVRRVRVIAELCGVPYTLIDTSTEDGQTALRMATPIWKVPTAEIGEKVLFDSRVIIDYMLRRYGNRHVRTESGEGRWREMNITNAVDGALDAAINNFYLQKEGAKLESLPYLKKQAARVESAMNWLEKEIEGGYFTDVKRIGLSEIAALTTLEWMSFRKAYDVTRHPGLMSFVEMHRERPELARTRPGEPAQAVLPRAASTPAR